MAKNKGGREVRKPKQAAATKPDKNAPVVPTITQAPKKRPGS